MVAQLADWNGTRIWHDQALIKRPWANPTSWHLDTPFWSFSDKRALSIWIALDDATYQNGCLYFIPGSCHETNFENPGIGKNNRNHRNADVGMNREFIIIVLKVLL